jgi:pyruvate-formate lyase
MNNNTKRFLKKNIVNFVKPIAKTLLSKKQRTYIRTCRTMLGKVSFKELFFNFKPFGDEYPGTPLSAKLYREMFLMSDVVFGHNYIYPFDPLKVRLLPDGITALASITPDYTCVLKSDLHSIKRATAVHNNEDDKFVDTLYGIIDAVEAKADQIKTRQSSSRREYCLSALFPELLYRDCTSLDEAIQKILFYNALFWQARHWHNGLGRLDLILNPYYIKDLESGTETYESTKSRLKDFCLLLGYHTKFKSPELIGDTGQYILLGGIDREGNNVNNDITRMFLEIFTEIKVPDPKLIFRVNDKTPADTWNLCIKCLSNGCGSPLFMNETLIMDNMVEFGYDRKDVWNLGTSACWEPLVIGKSSCQNNPFRSILACEALDHVLKTRKNFDSFDSLLSAVKKTLAMEVPLVVEDLNYDYSPLMSLFDSDCLTKGKDFSHKGTKYMYQGVQLLGLPNLVDSLLNIKKYVFDKHLITLDDCCNAIDNNYEGYEDLRQLFLGTNDRKFGSTSTEVLGICNQLIECVSHAIEPLRANGSVVKFGLSSPAYLSQAIRNPATLDGRKSGEPYAVHISPISSSIDISEILQFASCLNYPYNCLNGNVVDFIIPSSYQRQPEKLVSIIRDAFSHGLFQLQLNVLDKKTLIDAKSHPEKYPNLVVRVWGFSAYFNDLPEEYKDNLIARAGIYETA